MKTFWKRLMPTSSILALMLLLYAEAPAVYATVFACNSTGDLKNSFYTNESVYVSGYIGDISEKDVDVYVVSHRTTWPNGTSIEGISLMYKTIYTNSSGSLPITILWSNLEPGNFDIVADVDRDAAYNSTNDSVDNVTVSGFSVLEAPKPTLTLALGKNHPSSHNCDLERDDEFNVMMQINATASTKEDIIINSIALTGLGSGDDKEDIKVVYLVFDDDEDGKYDDGEPLLAYDFFIRDDGAIFFEIDDGFEIPAGSSSVFNIAYSMSDKGSLGDKYRFDLVTIMAEGKYSKDKVVINGLPLGSAIKTISNEVATTTTLPIEEDESTNITVLEDECQSDADCQGVSCANKEKTTYTCVYDADQGINVCDGETMEVECCGDADCVEGFYCLNYECLQEKSGGLFGWLGDLGGAQAGSEKNYKWTIVSIVLVSTIVISVFLIIKNRRKEPWKSKKNYERDWKGLEKKWEEKHTETRSKDKGPQKQEDTE